MDRKWWKTYGEDARSRFAGERVSSSTSVPTARTVQMDHFGNSGAAAIALAAKMGAKRVILIGYDCHKRGKAHWFGDHPKGLGNAGSLPKWPQAFGRLAKTLTKIDIVNCSPGTALTCFPTAELDEAL